MDKLLMTHEKGVLERAQAKRIEAKEARLRQKFYEEHCGAKPYVFIEMGDDGTELLGFKRREIASPSVGDDGVVALAVDVIELLDGLTVNDMVRVFDVAKTLVNQTHRVDADVIETLTTFE